MDRQEYREIINGIKTSYRNRDYERVIMYAKEIPLRKVKENSVIEMIATAYDHVGKPALARTTLETAYRRMSGGKHTAYKLAVLALKTNDIEGAVGYYEDFCRIAPNDNQRFILKYEIATEGGLSIYDRIRILEEYTEKETDDKWMYELAHLYHEAGMGDQCAEMCDDIVVWFSDGDYLKKALELKFQHKALTPTQQAMYEKIMQNYIEDYEEPEPVVEEPSPMEEAAAEEFANDFLENSKDPFAETKPIHIPEEMLPDEEEEDEDEQPHTKSMSLNMGVAEKTEDRKNIFYDFRLEDAALEPKPELSEWLASLPDIKEMKRASEERTHRIEEELSAEEDIPEEEIFAEIPKAGAEETEGLNDEALIKEDEQPEEPEEAAVEASSIFNEPIASEKPEKEDFEEGLKKLYSPALESIKETPRLDAEFDKKKVEIEEGQLGINLELLNESESEVEGQLSIDQLFQTYANNIENNLENKAAVAKVEAERLKQIRDAVESAIPETPILDIDEEAVDEAQAAANRDPDMDEEDRWDDDPVDKILNDFVAATDPIKKDEPVEQVELREEPETPAKELVIPDFLKNLHFDETEEEITEEDIRAIDEEDGYGTGDSDETDELAEEVAEEASAVHARTDEEVDEELDEMADFLDDFMHEEELIVEDEAKTAGAGVAAPVVGAVAQAAAVEAAASDDALDEIGDTLAEIFGDDDFEAPEEAEETVVEEEPEEDELIIEEITTERKAPTVKVPIEAVAVGAAAAGAVAEEAAVAAEAAEADKVVSAVEADDVGDDLFDGIFNEISDGSAASEAETTEAAEGVAEEETLEAAEAVVEEEVAEVAEEAAEEEAAEATEEAAEEEVAEVAEEVAEEEAVEVAEEVAEEEAVEVAEEAAEEEVAEAAEEVAEEEAIEEEVAADDAEKASEETEEAEEPVSASEESEEVAEEAEAAAEATEEATEEEAAEEEATEEEAVEAAEEAGEEVAVAEDIDEDDELLGAILDEVAGEPEAEAIDAADDAEPEEAVAEEATEPAGEAEAAEEDAEAEDEEPAEAAGTEETEETAEKEQGDEDAVEEAQEEASGEEDTEEASSGDTQQIEKIYKYSLDNETREEIAEFLLIEGMAEKVTDTVDNIILTNKAGDATGGNLIVTGDSKSGKTFLTISMIKAVNKELKAGSGKVAKVQSESLNGKDIEKVFQKIAGNDLIIENVGYLDDKTIDDIIEVMQSGKSQNMVVFEGNMLAVETIINKHPEVEKLFKNRVDIDELSITQWADVACDYAKRKGYKVGDMALLALHAKIDEINMPTSRFGYEDIVNIMEAAIEKCDKRNTGKLFSAFSRKDDDFIELSESDFV